jgi:hypothetical protein
MKKVPIVVRTMLLCEKASEKNGIWTLENPLSGILVMPGIDGAHTLQQVWLYTQLSGGLGSYNLSVQVRAIDEDFILGRSSTTAQEFPVERDMVLEQVFRFKHLQFPKSELYEFQLFANHVPVEDGAVFLSVLLGD